MEQSQNKSNEEAITQDGQPLKETGPRGVAGQEIVAISLTDEQKLTLVENQKHHSLDFLKQFAKDVSDALQSIELAQASSNENKNEESGRNSAQEQYLEQELDILKSFFTKESCAEFTQKVEHIKFLNDDKFPNLSYINDKNEERTIELDDKFWRCQEQACQNNIKGGSPQIYAQILQDIFLFNDDQRNAFVKLKQQKLEQYQRGANKLEIQKYIQQYYEGIHHHNRVTTFALEQRAKLLQYEDTATIGILGGGITALYTALIIKHLQDKQKFTNLKFQIIERTDRIGGRIKTHTYDENLFDWQYSDMGAMRLPVLHAPVYDMIDFINRRIFEQNKALKDKKPNHKDYPQIEVIPYWYQSIDARYIHNELPLLHKAEVHFMRTSGETGWSYLGSDIGTPDKYSREFTDKQKEFLTNLGKVKTIVEDHISDVEKQILKALKATTSDPPNPEEITKLYKEFGKYSVFSYLTQACEVSFEDVILYESVFAGSNELQFNLFDWILDDTSVSTDTFETSIWGRGPINSKISIPHRYFNTIRGGVQTITNAIYWLIGKENVIINSEVTRVELRTDEKIAVTYSTATTGIKQTAIYDRIVCTIPSPACANIDWIGQSYDDAEFIKVINSFRLLSYFPLFKLSLQFSKRFWEDTSLFIDGYCVVGGQISTDLSSRWFVLPSYGYEDGCDQPGTILIYNWTGDAIRWTGMDPKDQVARALNDLNIYFNSIRKPDLPVIDVRSEYYTGLHYSEVWSDTPATGTGFFGPNQYQYLAQLAKGIDGKLFFAGEYMSAHHAWIIGSISSACYAMRNIVGHEKFNHFLFPEDYDGPCQPLSFENFGLNKQ